MFTYICNITTVYVKICSYKGNMHFSEENKGIFYLFCDLDLDLKECLLRPFALI